MKTQNSRHFFRPFQKLQPIESRKKIGPEKIPSLQGFFEPVVVANLGWKKNKVTSRHRQLAPFMAKTAFATESINDQPAGSAMFPPPDIVLLHVKKPRG